MNRRLTFYGFLVTGLVLVPALSFAHDFFGDTQPLLNGVAHPILTVSHVLVLGTISLLVLTVKQPERLIGGLAVGLLFGFFLPLSELPEWMNLSLNAALLILGLVVVMQKYSSACWFYILPLFTGFLIGVDTILPEATIIENLVFYIGAMFGVLALFSYAVLLRQFIKQEWQLIVIRSLGAWMVAIALMMLAFDLRSALALV